MHKRARGFVRPASAGSQGQAHASDLQAPRWSCDDDESVCVGHAALHRPAAEALPLLALSRVGRSNDCQIALSDARVSQSHAELRHAGKGVWILRDLGSKNGTFVRGKRVAPGDDVILENDDEVAFGQPSQPWLFAAGLPHKVVARRIGTNEFRSAAAEQALLAIPTAADPHGTILQMDGAWMWEVPDLEPTPLRGGQVILVPQGQYRVWLSELLDPTEDARDAQRALRDATLSIALSQDQEQVRAQLFLRDIRSDLPSRVYLYMLVELARYRQEDAASGIQASEAGWRYADDVARALNIDQQTLNVQVYRARRDLAKLGFSDPGGLVERRTMTKQMRIGLPEDRIRFELAGENGEGPC